MKNREDLILKISDFVKKQSKADDFEVSVHLSDSSFFRFGDNCFTQNGTGEKQLVSIKSSFGSKSGLSTLNSIDEENLLKAMRTSEEIAHLNQDDPEHVASAKNVEIPKTENYSQNTADLSSKELVEIVGKTIDRAKAEGVKTSGIVEKTVKDRGLFTKNGFYGYDRESFFEQSCTFFDGTRETKNVVETKDFSNYDLDRELDKISSKLGILNNPKQSVKGKIPVILTPRAVASYFAYLFYDLNRREADLGLNCFAGKLGSVVFGEKFSLRSSLNETSLNTTGFSGGGIIAQNIDWIKDGVLCELLTSRDWGNKNNLDPNFKCNWVVDGGDESLEEMMRKVERGLIVNNFWYIRKADAKNGIYTGLTRDGVNYFEGGEIKHSVTNLRFNESHTDMTRRILSLGKQEQTGFSHKVPSMLIDDFNFVDVTSF